MIATRAGAGVDAPRGLQNARDVGGLPIDGGGHTRHGVLLRSDAPHPGDEPPALRAWPPELVIDLRAPGEAEQPHPLVSAATRVVSVPLMNAASLAELAAAGDAELGLGDLYLEIVRRQGRILARVAALVARADGPVLVHCSAGKDRTGAAVAVLLSAVGVGIEDVLRDFSITQRNMTAVLRRLSVARASDGVDLVALATSRPHVFEASLPAMRAMLAELGAQPGGAAGWLVDQGLAPADLELLRARLVVRAGVANVAAPHRRRDA